MGTLEEKIIMAYKIFNNNKKYVYVHIPKTGGTTIEHISGLGIVTMQSIVGHITLKHIKNLMDDYEEHISFTTVRNPWSWYVSWYFYLQQGICDSDSDFLLELENIKKKGNTFTDFIRFIYDNRDTLSFDMGDYKALKYQQMLEWGYDGKKYVDHFIKIEELSEEKLKEIGLSVNYTHMKKNESKHDHYSTYYTDESIEIVRNMHEDDIKYFNYKFENK